MKERDFEWLRVFSVAIGGTRAFDEIDKLRQRLESENASLRAAAGDEANHAERTDQKLNLQKVI